MTTENFAERLAQASGKASESKESTFQTRQRRSNKKEAAVSSAPSMENNPFAKIVAETRDPKAQKQRMVELLTHVDAETTAENKKHLSEYNAFMQSERQRLAVELIEMTDTKTFSNMQRVLTDINNGVLDFEEQSKPFMEIINAVRLIQQEDATTDLLAEMREEKKLRAKLDNELAAIRRQIELHRKEIKDNDISITMAQKERSWLGYGSIKKSALEKIAKLTAENDELEAKIAKLKNSLKEKQNEVVEKESKYAHLAEAKKIMATMLDLSEEEHEARHQQLIETASNFVTSTKARVDETLGHSMKMDDQLKALSNLAFTMRGRYATLSEAAKEAEVINSEKHVALKSELESIEDPLERLEKEGLSRDLAKHITTLNDTARETVDVISDLSVSSQRIETMEAANKAQIRKTEQIQTSGIAGVADNLSSVLTAINQAAIGQASTAAQQSLRRMNTNTIELTKEGMLNAAKAQNDENAMLIKALEQLGGFGEVIELANQSASQAVEDNRALVDELKHAADGVTKAAQGSLNITSQTISDELEAGKQQ